MNIKENIQRLLDDESISNYAIHKETGVAQSTLSDIKTGKSELGNMRLDVAIKLNKYYLEEMERMKNQVWERENYTVEMIDHDYDLKAFEVTQGDKVQVIYPATIEDMEQIITDLNNGEDVDGWEDGLGNTIVID